MGTIFGMDEDFFKLTTILRQSSNKWVTVFGAPGAGKTLLARLVADNLWDHFRGEVYWITLGKSPSVGKLQCQLLKEVTKDESQEACSQQALIDALCRRKVLLVLDNAWDRKIVSLFNVVSNNSKILITTRQPLLCTGDSLEMKGLSEESSQKLFQTYAGPKFNLLMVRYEDACERLPLLLKIVGAAASLQVELSLPSSGNDNLLMVAKIGYDALVTKFGVLGRQLQQCLLLLAAFPDNASTSRFDVIKCWKGEGFLHADNSESEASRFLEALIKQGLVEVTYNGHEQARMFSLHDLVREMLLTLVPEAQNCLFRAGTTNPISAELLVNNKKWISLIDSEQVQGLPETIVLPPSPSTTILLLDNNPSLLSIRRSIFSAFPNLKVLSLKATGITHLPLSIGNLVKLVTLDISYSKVEYIPTTLRNLTALEYLDMSHCYHLKFFLPKVFAKLTKVRYLNTEGTLNAWNSSRVDYLNRVVIPYASNLAFFSLQVSSMKLLQRLWIDTDIRISLPSSIGNLLHLKLLHVYSTKAIKHLPMGLLSLKSLEDLRLSPLSQHVLPPKFSDSFPNLRVLWLGFATHLWLLPANILKLEQLTHLKVNRSSTRSIINLPQQLWKLELSSFKLAKDLSVLSSLKSLRVLRLLDCPRLEQLPSMGHDSFPLLKELCLHNCKSLRNLPIFKGLPKLKTLSISSCNFEYLPTYLGSSGAFPCLEILQLSNMSQLVELSELEQGACPKLRFLGIKSCDKLAYMNWVLPQLEELRIQRCKNLKTLLLNAKMELQYLDLSYTQLQELPQSLSVLSWLRELELQGCGSISQLPYIQSETRCYPSLEQLNLVSSGISLNGLPESLKNRQGLHIHI